MSGNREGPAALDGPMARLAAVGVALAGLALLGWIHRGDLLPPDETGTPAYPREAAFNACFGPSAARFAAMLEAGELTQEQATLYRNRAEAFCADQAEKGRLPVPGQ